MDEETVVAPNQETVWVLPIVAREIVRISVVGIIIGIVTWGMTILFEAYIFGTLLCGSSGEICESATTYAAVAGTVFGAGSGLFALIKSRVYRPLLVVIMVMAALWGVTAVLHAQNWTIQLGSMVFLYGLTYAVFAWLARIYNIWLAATVMIVVLVIARLMLNG